MISIELKTTSPIHDYQRTIIAFLSIPFDPTIGFQGDEILICYPLREKVDAAKDTLEVTPEEYHEICRRVRNGHFKEMDKLTYQMIEDITNATK